MPASRALGPGPTHTGGMAAGEEGLDRRPDGVTDATVEAVGKLSEAFETIEEVRGRLYGLHRLTGSADLALGDACDQLRKAVQAAGPMVKDVQRHLRR